ncbi:MAG: hypothetical protein K2O45_08780 [Oscillospiraceae bacterium]|nr:hypothetical protein [Oscillospiraceae bacterium]
MPKKYRLYDVYECEFELLGEFDTMQDVRRAAIQRDKETDGECCLTVSRFYEIGEVYERLRGWTY